MGTGVRMPTSRFRLARGLRALWLSRRMRALFLSPRTLGRAAKAYQLSPREKEVFALWVTGHGSKYIQEKFVISPATVKTHVRHIYEKCDVHNRAELMRKLEEAG